MPKFQTGCKVRWSLIFNGLSSPSESVKLWSKNIGVADERFNSLIAHQVYGGVVIYGEWVGSTPTVLNPQSSILWPPKKAGCNNPSGADMGLLIVFKTPVLKLLQNWKLSLLCECGKRMVQYLVLDTRLLRVRIPPLALKIYVVVMKLEVHASLKKRCPKKRVGSIPTNDTKTFTPMWWNW